MGLAEGELDATCILCARGVDAADAGRVLKRLPCECIACEACTARWLTWEGRRGEEGGEGARRCWMGHDLAAEAIAGMSEAASSYVESLPIASVEDAAAWLGRALLLPGGNLSDLSVAERIGAEDANARVLTATLTIRGPVGETMAVPVAVKSLQVNNARRMAREVGTAMRASLQCPRVCKVYGCVRRGVDVWLVMERCAGSLEGRLRELGGAGLPTAELARVARDVCASLAELHECGVVHCDIKPANCLVREDATVVLADFGGSKASVYQSWGGADGRAGCMVAGWRAQSLHVTGVRRCPQPMDRTAQSTLTHTAPYASLDQQSAVPGVRPGEFARPPGGWWAYRDVAIVCGGADLSHCWCPPVQIRGGTCGPWAPPLRTWPRGRGPLRRSPRI